MSKAGPKLQYKNLKMKCQKCHRVEEGDYVNSSDKMRRRQYCFWCISTGTLEPRYCPTAAQVEHAKAVVAGWEASITAASSDSPMGETAGRSAQLWWIG